MSDALDSLNLDLSGVDLTGIAAGAVAGLTTTTIPVKPSREKKTASPPPKFTGGRRNLYFDLETVPDESRLEVFGLDPLPEMPPVTPNEELPSLEDFLKLGLSELDKLLATLNPPDTWLAAVECAERAQTKPRKGFFDSITTHCKRIEGITEAATARKKLLSVTPEYCRIVALGYAVGDDPACGFVVGPQPNGGEFTERTLLEHFWSLVSKVSPIVGFNVLGFDLPVIYVRSALLGVKPTKLIDMKPWGGEVVDLMKVRYPASASKGLKELARLYGIEVPAEGVDGSMVGDLIQTDPQKVCEYVKSDIEVTRSLHHFFKGFFTA